MPKAHCFLAAVLALTALAAKADKADSSTPASLDQSFVTPPAEARPWVYWFWNNGAVTREGITADLESMARVGIGGMILMDVLERHAPPKGDATFMSETWQELFTHAVSEAARLGLEITMTNGPGWCGSSGPWITPELSMQMLVFSETKVDGSTRFSGLLPKPDPSRRLDKDYLDSHLEVADFYRDIAVLAFPCTKDGTFPRDQVIDLTDKTDATGKLTWSAPPGEWIILRLGHTTTGSSTRPPVLGGNGLECDKLSARAMDVHFDAMMKKLIKRVGTHAGKSLIGTHIDSWEVGYQDWTPDMRSEFQKRRGYDPLLFLPNLVTGPPDPKSHRIHHKSGKPLWHVGGKDLADRFRWDFWQTVSELLAENNSGRLAARAQEHGLRMSIEGYDLPFGDEAAYAGAVDEPMCEFWTRTQPDKPIRMLEKCRQMASVGHVMGCRVIGAEAFTADAHEQWKFHPAIIKSLGDYIFSLGINRFVIHRFAHQPWLDRAPGAVMGPWGLHYERTNTWWEMSTAWHTYLARCQFMLRQGLPVADLLYLRPHIPNQNHLQFDPPVPTGYQADDISAGTLMARASVKDGRIVLPNGTSYRMLVLPKITPTTSEMLEKIRDLVAAGATILGAPPKESPSLAGYPDCDDKVCAIAGEVWGDGTAKTPAGHSFGKGRVFQDQPLPRVLAALDTAPDFRADLPRLNWCHRVDGDTDLYFIANPADTVVSFNAQFRVAGKSPEFWHPDTGRITPATAYQSAGGITRLPITLDPSGSVFVVFRKPSAGTNPVVRIERDGKDLFPRLDQQDAGRDTAAIVILRATYGVPGDAKRTLDVTMKIQSLVDAGQTTIDVASLAKERDPAHLVVKTLHIDYSVGDKSLTASGKDTQIVNLVRPGGPVVVNLTRGEFLNPGTYRITHADGHTNDITFKPPQPLEITGSWELRFPPKRGALDSVTLPVLACLTKHSDPGVRYFSGTATYHKTFDVPATFLQSGQTIAIELGDVQVMARVILNGYDLGILWKSPYLVNVGNHLKAGANTLEIAVANLWPNRMIGDAALPEAHRVSWSAWQPFTPKSPLLPSGLLGPVRLLVAAPVPRNTQE